MAQAAEEAKEAKFQFTHPGKGATIIDVKDKEALRVSIHAPWEGCDERCVRR